MSGFSTASMNYLPLCFVSTGEYAVSINLSAYIMYYFAYFIYIYMVSFGILSYLFSFCLHAY